MTLWATFADSALVHALGWSLVHLTWIAVLIGFATPRILQATSATASHRRYAIALAAFLATTAVAPIATAIVLLSWHHAVFAGTLMVQVVTAPVVPAPAGWVDAGVVRFYAAMEPLLPWVVAGWIGGVLVGLLRLTVAQRRVRSLIATASPAATGLAHRICVLARRVGGARWARCGVTDRVSVPTVAGVFTPWILVPLSTARKLGRAELDTLLIHELAHVRRGDPLVNWFQCLAEALCFFHPSVIHLSMLVRREREFCCDDLVVTAGVDAGSYARALTKLEVLRSREYPLAIAATDGPLMMRVLRLIGHRHQPGRAEKLRATVTAGAATMALLAALPVAGAPYVDGATLPPALQVLALPIHIDGADPAGKFTMTLQRHRIIDATMDGVSVPPERMVQRGDSIQLLAGDGRAPLAVRLTPLGGISWAARRPGSVSAPVLSK